MSKSTPLEQLPQGANSGNVQMNITSEQMSGISMQPQPPQPQMGNQMHEMQLGNQMSQDMSIDNEYQRMDAQDNFMKRQFVSGAMPPNMAQPPPSDGYYESPSSNYRQGGYQNQKQMNVPHFRKNDSIEETIKSPVTSVYELFKSNSKMLVILFALFIIVQMEMVQSIIRTVVRMTKVPDNMIFTVSKVFTSFVGVVLFFIVYRNL